ncbi:hypothetical protein MSUIS_01480 [Mycoplasma suis KI3806]|uniref:Lipoprotein n=1 Tax=Mycoplasma suis (strain KI_3806) TaxID=708248 RepID=F0V319_MYCS3|nr:hypothetical protein [Mycoplasma suis]CBZ40241.1 hypothetical protein MSUIS_01480 [Mycoplasma suis KI3806]
MTLGSKSLILSSFLGLGVTSCGGFGINYLLENRNPSSPKELKSSISGNKIVSSSSAEISPDIKEIEDTVIVSEDHKNEKSENLTPKRDIHNPEQSYSEEDTSPTVEQLKDLGETFGSIVIYKKENSENVLTCDFWKLNDDNVISDSFSYDGQSCQDLSKEVLGELQEKQSKIWMKSNQKSSSEILAKHISGVPIERFSLKNRETWSHEGWNCQNQQVSENLEKIIVICEKSQDLVEIK